MAAARRRLSDVLTAAQEQPQVLYRRNEPVGAVVGRSELARLQAATPVNDGSLAQAFDELRQILLDEDLVLVIPHRASRPNAFVDDVSR